jgi:hypothetical protein
MDKRPFTVLLVEDDLNDIFVVKRAFRTARIPNPPQMITDGEEAVSYQVEHLFESITHYWGLECAKPQLEVA